MGIISLEQTDHLLWLGRYTERVYTTLKLYCSGFDKMIDSDEMSYKELCQTLEIPDVYGSKEVFLGKYAFDEENYNSIMSNMRRAYDNAIVLREEIGTDTFCYLQMALYEMQKASGSIHPMIDLQKVMDDIVAFWGMADDSIENERERNLIKLGKRIERVDLYCRIRESGEKLQREIRRLEHRIRTAGIAYSAEHLAGLQIEMEEDPIDYRRILILVDGLLK